LNYEAFLTSWSSNGQINFGQLMINSHKLNYFHG